MSIVIASRKRLVLLSVGLFCLFSLLIVQFFKLQILEGKKWRQRADRQHQMVVIEPCRRGLFYSNTTLRTNHPEKPEPLVVDVPKFHLYVDPKSVAKERSAEIVKELSSLLKLDGPKKKHLKDQFEKESRSRKLSMWLDPEVKEQIERWWGPYAKRHKIARNALFFIQDYQRSYPYGKLLGQVLHTVSEERDPKTLHPVPTGGLELVFNEVLQGSEGKRRLLRSPRHALESGEVLVAPEDGADIYLTINHHLQAIAEEEIARAVKDANAKAGWAILMEPSTGEIWALAQYPYFEPAKYKEFFKTSQQAEKTKMKAAIDPFEPGSTMKPLTAVLALKANQELIAKGEPPLFYPNEKMKTANGQFPGRSKPITDPRVHHYLNMDMALQKSSNIYVSRLAQKIVERLGAKWYREALQDVFGFGVKTGVELASESAGLVPTPGKYHQNGKPEWSTPTPFSIAFGHNILASSFQILKSYAVLANGGFDVKPTLVRQIIRENRDGTSEVLLDHLNNRSRRRVVDKEIVDQVVHSLRFVTKHGGSAPKADIPGYTEVGKTGTTEKIVGGKYSKKDHFSTFIGFAPAKNPRFVLLVAVDEPEKKYIPGFGSNQYGGNCCGPAFSRIGLRTLEYLGVEPDDPYGYPVGDSRRNPAKADLAGELKALKELYDLWNTR